MDIRYADRLQVELESTVQSSAAGPDWQSGDVSVEQVLEKDRLKIFLTADLTPVKGIALRWVFSETEKPHEPVKVYSDAWERGYGDMEWRGLVPERMMPWVCACSNGSDSRKDTSDRWTQCFGVAVQPAAFCLWQMDAEGITLRADVRCGGEGVRLHGRRLPVCEVLFARCEGVSAFSALQTFYRSLCTCPLRLSEPVYGANNWYYAYGKSSAEDILRDARLLKEMTEGLANRPYMVIDEMAPGTPETSGSRI